MNLKEKALFLLMGFSSAFCGYFVVTRAHAEEVSMNIAERHAVSIAEKYIKNHYPDFKKDKMHVTIKSHGSQWEVTYELPPYMIGGAPVVLIDKATNKVVCSYRTQ